jgi:hypothetical protein
VSFVTLDTGAKFSITLLEPDSDIPRDLTAATVTMKARRADGTLLTRGMTITSAAGGQAEVTFAATELVKGRMVIEVEVAQGSTVISTRDTYTYYVRPKV